MQCDAICGAPDEQYRSTDEVPFQHANTRKLNNQEVSRLTGRQHRVTSPVDITDLMNTYSHVTKLLPSER